MKNLTRIASTAVLAAGLAVSGATVAGAATTGGVVDFTQGGATSGASIEQASDLSKLAGTSQPFTDFIGGELEKAQQAGEGCPGAAHAVTVAAYSPDGYAAGSVNDCGGHESLWKFDRASGQWTEFLGTQDIPECGVLRDANFSAEVYRIGMGGECLEGGQTVPYQG